MSRALDHNAYYRLPWTLADNAITWLEPTTRCNLYCEGCYRENDPGGHKPLDVVIQELEVVRRLRNTFSALACKLGSMVVSMIRDSVFFLISSGNCPLIQSFTGGTLRTCVFVCMQCSTTRRRFSASGC